MEEPDEFRQLVAYLGQDSADAIRHWCHANGFRVQIPQPPWESSDGYSGASLHSLIVDKGRVAYKVIVKRIPPWPEGPSSGWPAGEPGRHRYFLENDPSGFARDHLVGQRFEAVTTREGAVLMFQDLAADGSTCVPLAKVPPARLADACALVIGEVVGRWNGFQLSSKPTKVSRFLYDEIGKTIASGGTVNRWARRVELLSFKEEWIRFAEDGPALPNPLPMAAGYLHPAIPSDIQVLCGRTHGDLHLLNILIPGMTTKDPDLGAFQIIDLATATDFGSLTRDLVTMMLSAIATGLDDLPENRRQELIRHAVDAGRGDGAEPPFAVTTSMCATFTEVVGAAKGGWTESWHLQYWLTLQALGLAFTAYEGFSPTARWWFLQLASHAAGRVLTQFDPEPRIPGTVRLLENPFRASAGPVGSHPPVLPTDESALLSAYQKLEGLDPAGRERVQRLTELVDRAAAALGRDHERTLTFEIDLAERLEKISAKRALNRYAELYPRARAVLGAEDPITKSCERALRRWDLRRRAEEEDD